MAGSMDGVKRMTDFEKYLLLKDRADKTGQPEEVNGLSQLLHLIQFMHAEEESWKQHKNRMNEWKNNIIKSVEESLKQLEEDKGEMIWED
jgi:hypothetical protein